MRHLKYFAVGFGKLLLVLGFVGAILGLIAGYLTLGVFLFETFLPDHVFVLGARCMEYSHTEPEKCASYFVNNGDHFAGRMVWALLLLLATCIFSLIVSISYNLGRKHYEKS